MSPFSSSNFNASRVLITGGSGFIGTNLIEDLIRTASLSICNIDITQPKLSTHEQYWRQIDIRNFEELRTAIKNFKPDLVFHLAARTDLDGSSLEDYDSNHVGTENVAIALEEVGFNGTAVFASSMYVCTPGYQPKHDKDYCPHTIYGQSKVESEMVLYSKELHFNWCIVRPTSIWGPWFAEPYKKFFEIVCSGKFLKIRGENCFRTYGYVGNAVAQARAIAKAISEQKVNTRMFYLGDREAYEINQWADEIAHIAGRRNFVAPYFAFKALALIGDILGKFGIKFPMTSFRLKNMTTNNVLDLSALNHVLALDPFSRSSGNLVTIEWLKRHG